MRPWITLPLMTMGPLVFCRILLSVLEIGVSQTSLPVRASSATTRASVVAAIDFVAIRGPRCAWLWFRRSDCGADVVFPDQVAGAGIEGLNVVAGVGDKDRTVVDRGASVHWRRFRSWPSVQTSCRFLTFGRLICVSGL